MATKTQAKAAVDSAATDIKNDIDNIIPVGANIKDGVVNFGPTQYLIVLDAGGVVATADSWLSTIQTNLTAASRPFTLPVLRRRKTDRKNQYVVIEAKLTVRIINF